MATIQMSPPVTKSSFAKVAASASKENFKPIMGKPNTSSKSTPDAASNIHGGTVQVNQVASTLQALSLGSGAPSLVVNGSNMALPGFSRGLTGRESVSDESQKADSNSELGTKPPSLDEKSITSGTTFALDEKESLRPDDSASVKASADDDDSFSVRGSLLAGSRVGSDAAASRRGQPLQDVPGRRLAQPLSGSQNPVATVTAGVPAVQAQIANPPIPLAEVGKPTDALNAIYRQAPDEKLIEALATPRDRYFLLRLEKDVIDFVQDSTEPYMDLPPSNSFCRMLTHKLADYYHMTHSFEPNIGSVRIFRTPFCRVPPSLALMSPLPNASNASTPPPVALPRKIMRRGQEGDGGNASAGASKTTSETGSDAKEKPPSATQKLSREEREEMYKLARERIFGNSEESTNDTDAANDMSRTSSMSASRSNVPRRAKNNKQRRDDSDSFDSRYEYTPYWGGPQQQMWIPQQQMANQYAPPMAAGFAGQVQLPPQAPMSYAQYPIVPPGVHGAVHAGSGASYPIAQYPPHINQPQYPPSGSSLSGYGSPTQMMPQSQNWQPQYPSSPSSSQGRAPRGMSRNSSQPGFPYPFGQLPSNTHPYDPKSQHPIPGSYNRNQGFNPMTQSFVPGGNMPPALPTPHGPFPGSGSHPGSPQVLSSPLAYPAYQQPGPQPYGGYGMVRQGSSNSVGSYHGPQHQHMPMMHSQYSSPMAHPSNSHTLPPSLPPPPPPPMHMGQHPHSSSGRPVVQPSTNQMFGNLPTYGNPATLPQKPGGGMQ